MDLITDIQIARTQLIREIDATFEQLIQRVKSYEAPQDGASAGRSENQADGYESIYPLSAASGIFKGQKPTGVLFGEERVDIYTWKMAFKEILLRCIADPEKHVALMNLRGKVSGRKRMLLSKGPEGMRSPLEIAPNLYVETHYDTETLMRILMTRILDAVKYDYSHISVAIRNSQ